MKSNHRKMLFIFIFLVVFLTACSKSNPMDDVPSENTDNSTTQLDVSSADRKIIYEAEATLYVDDVQQAVESIRTMLQADEWFDDMNVSSSYSYLIVRVKTDHLDSFVDALKDDYIVNNYLKKATDVSLQYQSTQNQIDSYNAERDRLLVLYATASLTDMITINTRISEIDLALGELQGTLNTYDSLIDYSKVTLTIRPENIGSKLPFGTRIVDGFVNGFNALISFFDGLIIIFATLLPFIIVFVPGGYGVYKLYQYYEKKRLAKRQSNDNKSS